MKVLADFCANVFTFLFTHQFSQLQTAESAVMSPAPNAPGTPQIVIVIRCVEGSWP
jgi:hypothetical protein